MQGIVFDIRRFTVHDGPGIRSTVFTKGCPLGCVWCQNPEGRENKIDLWYFRNKCIGCLRCIDICPNKALSPQGKEAEGLNAGNRPDIRINRKKCGCCGKCVEACPAKAMAFDGRVVSSDEVVKELLKDRVFYETSGGGITISGGEPLFQHQFNLEILKKCKDEKLHTAIETCLYSGKEILEQFLGLTDLFIADMKIFDSGLHKAATGKNNELIKSNLEMLVERGAEVMVRIPVIPGFTDSVENIRSIASYIYGLKKDMPVELINFNPFAKNKYRLMEAAYRLDERLTVLPAEVMNGYKRILGEEGLSNIIEG